MKKIATLIAAVAMAAVANATPYKNLTVAAEIYPAGSGVVYLDPIAVNKDYVKEQSEDYAESVILKGTFGETSNKKDMSGRPGFINDCTGDLSYYPVELTIIPADGYEIVCVANEVAANGEYSEANCYMTNTGSSIQDYEFSFDFKAREANPINANSAAREEDCNADMNGSMSDKDRQDEAWGKANWHETPDTKYYVIMRPEGATTPSFELSEEATGVENAIVVPFASDAIYNVNGQKVGNNAKGLVIKAGKKIVK